MAAFRGATDNSELADEADRVFLRFAQSDCLEAERVTLEWIQVAGFLDKLVPITGANDNVQAEVRAFIKERLVRRRFPRN